MKFLGQGFDMGAESGEEAVDSPAAMSAPRGVPTQGSGHAWAWTSDVTTTAGTKARSAIQRARAVVMAS